MNRQSKIAARPTRRIAPSGAGARRYYVPLGLILIALTTFLVYLPAIHGGRLWDDDCNLTSPALQSFAGLYRIWFDPKVTAKSSQYYPLVHTAFWLEHKLWGNTYWAYHLVNVLWHTLSVLLVYVIVERLLIPGALLAAAVFAVHPVMVESVAWMTEQKNTLSTVFYLAAVWMYLDFDQSRRRSRYLVALAFFAMALLSKSATVTLPFALLVILWWQRGTLSWRRDGLSLAPFFLLGAAASVMTIWVERKLVGAEGADFELSFLQRFLLSGRDIWFYLGKLVWPANLSFIYPRWTIDPTQWWQWTYSILALATTFVLWSVRKRFRGPLAAWLFFCGTLAPVLGFLNVYMFKFTYVADHLQYLASLGMIVLASAGIALALARAPLATRRLLLAACIAFAGTLAMLAWRQSHVYADVVALYQATLEVNPNCWMAHNNLGFELADRGKTEQAIEHYRAALRLKPNYAEAHNNLGLTLVNAGQYLEAIDEIQAALQIAPDYAEAHNNLGNALTGAHRPMEAIWQYREAIRIDPDFYEACHNLGLALLHAQQFPEAIQQFDHAVRLQPDDADAHNSLGSALDGAGQRAEAIEEFRAALDLDPDYTIALYNLGNALLRSGRFLEAIQPLERAQQLKPDFVEALAALAQALAVAGRSQEAIAAAEKAIGIADSTGRPAEAKQIEAWLKTYRSESRRTGAAPASQPPASASEQTKSQ